LAQRASTRLLNAAEVGYIRRMAFEFAGATDVGLKRDHNEDSMVILPQHRVAAVCDGMGGHEAGEVASGIAVETVKKFFELAADPNATWPFRYDRAKDEGTNLLSIAAQWANQRIREAGNTPGGAGRRGMGTTFVGCYVREDKAWFGWVGDSRGYLFRRGELIATTSDHSLLNELIRTGRLSEDEVENFQHKNVITRALGMGEAMEVDVNAVDLQPDDVCVVCCDGLTGMVTDERIAGILDAERDLQRAADKLIDEANANGGVDNITVALIRYTKED
jgi:PPM family protein phosphatase